MDKNRKNVSPSLYRSKSRRSDKKQRDKNSSSFSLTYNPLPFSLVPRYPRNPRREFAKAGSKVSSGLKERFEDKIKVEKEGNGRVEAVEECAQGEDDSCAEEGEIRFSIGVLKPDLGNVLIGA